MPHHMYNPCSCHLFYYKGCISHECMFSAHKGSWGLQVSYIAHIAISLKCMRLIMMLYSPQMYCDLPN